MVHIIIGAVITASFLLVKDYARKRGLRITWWQWVLTVLGFAYTTFVLEMIVSFLAEGSPKAAVVMGVIFGFFAVVWGVLLARFVFKKKNVE
jgi:hypothetical protein